MLFGVVATEAGLPIEQVIGFSIVVIAGAAQFTAVQLMADQAPTFIVLTTALVVNLRMAMYSASLAQHLGSAPLWKRMLVAYFNVDQTYALSQLKYDREPARSVPAKLAYFFGCVTSVCPFWFAFTWLGAVTGGAIPPEYALDFAVPITFLALIAPALRTLAHVAAAVTSVVLALALAWLPSGVGLIVAAVVAMAVGARTERWLDMRRGAR